MSQPREASPAAPPKSTALYTFAVVWTILVTLIPAVFGVIMLISPGAVTTPGLQAADVLRAMSYRNFAASAVLALALLTQPKRVVAFLLVARGLTELADGLSGVFVTSAGAAVGPYIGGIGDLLIAYYFFKLVDPNGAPARGSGDPG
jgi:hypothetical protein